MQVAPGELGGRIGGVQVRGRHGPDVDGPGALPPDEDGPGGGRVSQGVVIAESHALAGLPDQHPLASDRILQTPGDVEGALGALGICREPAQGEDATVDFGDDVCGISRAPHLGVGLILPDQRGRALDAGMDGEDGGARDAVLETGMRRGLEGPGTEWETAVEVVGPPPMGEHL